MKFRMEVAKLIGPGFELPKIETVEVVTSSHENGRRCNLENSGEDLAPWARFELATLRLIAGAAKL